MTTEATPGALGSNDQLGLRPERAKANAGPGQLEAEVLRNLANHARFVAEAMGACDGSMSAQKAACLEWLACGAEYQQMLRGGPRVSTAHLLKAQENLVKQIRFLEA